MKASEFGGWRRHFSRYPPAEYILALIWLTVARALGNDQAEPGHMGCRLEPPEMRQRREAKETEAQQIALVAFVSAAYRQGKGDG